MNHFFAPCPRGLEETLASELRTLEILNPVIAAGGVAFAGDLGQAARVNLWSRIASRVLLRVAHARYRTERDVHALAKTVRWPEHFDVNRTIRVDTVGTQSPVKSLDFVTLTVKDAVCDVFRDAGGERPSVDKNADVRIHVHLDATHATLYLDTSGEPLFMRGYRSDTGQAPIRENLAAGILALSGWQPGQVLYDPMCGSGTFLIEAALIERGIAPGAIPGIERHFGFERLSAFAPDARATAAAYHPRSLSSNVLQAPLPEEGLPARLFGSDILGDMTALTLRNAAKAGVADWIATKQGNFLELKAPAPSGVLIANPPYGERLAGDRLRTAVPARREESRDQRQGPRRERIPSRDASRRHDNPRAAPVNAIPGIGEDPVLAALYPQIGDHLKKNYAGWHTQWFTGDLRFGKLVGLKPTRKIVLYNGNIECRLFEVPVMAGSARGKAETGEATTQQNP